MITENISKQQKGNDANRMLATADQLVNEVEQLLKTCWFTKKNEYSYGFNVNDIRPKLEKLVNDYKSQKGGCC